MQTEPEIAIPSDVTKKAWTEGLLMSVLFVILGAILTFGSIYFLKPSLITKEVEKVVKEKPSVIETKSKEDERNSTWTLVGEANIKKILEKYSYINANGNEMQVILYESSLKKALYKISLMDVKQNKVKNLLSSDKNFNEENYQQPLSIFVDISPDKNYILIYNDPPAEGFPIVYIYDENGMLISKDNTGETIADYMYKNAPKELGMTSERYRGWVDSDTYLLAIQDGISTFYYYLKIPSLVITLVK